MVIGFTATCRVCGKKYPCGDMLTSIDEPYRCEDRRDNPIKSFLEILSWAFRKPSVHS